MIKVNYIVSQLQKNKVVALPTDTIYGLSCLPNQVAINQLLNLKKRKKSKGLILLSSDAKYLKPFLANDVINLLIKQYQATKQPTTFVVSSNHYLAINQTLAVRITNHTLINEICNKVNSAIISTSANITRKKIITALFKLRLFFGNNISGALAPKMNSKPSTIINLTTGVIYRDSTS